MRRAIAIPIDPMPPRRRVLATLIASALSVSLHQPVFAVQEQPVKKGKTDQTADTVEFDTATLKARGIDPAVAGYFKHAPRFTPGSHAVSLSVNGNPRGTVSAEFDAQGHLCVSTSLLRQAGLVVPPALQQRESSKHKNDTSTAAKCYDYRRDYPQTTIQLRPGEDAVALLVPSEALAAPATEDVDHSAQGGRAAIFNYNVLDIINRNGSRSSQYKQADTEIGFNTNDWIVRSRQIISWQQGRKTWSHPYAYAQHTFVKEKTVFQGGRINVANTLFPIGTIEGVQLFPETALARAPVASIPIQGIAQTPARVEVRQLGALLYTTLVPAGPFTLTAPALISATADLRVTVFETTGAQHAFVVPAAAFNAGQVWGAPRGWSIALGRLKNQGYGDHAQMPWLVTASDSWRLGRRANISSGILLSSPYQALAGGLDFAPVPNISTAATVIASHTRGGHQGVQFNISANTTRTKGVNVLAAITQQTAGYRYLNQITVKPAPVDLWQPQSQPWLPQQETAWQENSDQLWLIGQLKSQYTFGVSWSGDMLGSFTLNANHTTTFYGPSNRSLGLTWSRSLRHASVSMSIQHDLSRNSAFGNVAYLRVNVPLGRSSLNTYVTRSDRALRMGATFTGMVNPMLGYSLEAARDITQRTTDLTASVQVTPRYTRLSLMAARSNPGSTMISTQASGGLLVGDGGVTFSPYSIQDTFGLVSMRGVSGARIDTPVGSVWTDYRGHAVLPSLQAYKTSRIQVATKTLPRNVDLSNGLRVLSAGRGSVNHVEFQVMKVRRTLLSAHMSDGTPVPMGAVVLDAHQNFVTSTGDDGLIFLPNDTFVKPLNLRMTNGDTCQLDYVTPKETQHAFYDTVDAICKPTAPATP